MARRVLALILLGLVLVFCVALAASESLTNRTGRTATAVTVTFSEQVRITSYDEGVFPTKEPSSRSETFRFSGGQLENGARFSLSWTPSTAEITNTEWETTGAASSGNTGSDAPLTYEEIMAQIAHYPGPDEPLYVPAEGEQIWLTDLEGHADIYDNDSIKINYASGFDKSQITRIDAYRNGVKLRFVPALFDVLTNEQMKTFDGNPLEHTPKSSHTDHAIVGYQYEFRISRSAPTATLTARVRNPFSFRGTKYAFISHDFFSRLFMSDSELLNQLRMLKAQGFTGIEVTVQNYSPGSSASTVFKQYAADPAICSEGFRTATLDELRRVLMLTREAGLASELHVQLWNTLADGGGTAYEIRPANVSAWFDSYEKLCDEYAQVAQETGVALLTVGVELNTMERYADRWCRLVEKVRRIYSGAVTFSEAAHHYLLLGPFDAQLWGAKETARFWDCFDAIGLNSWTPPVATGSDPTVSQMTQKMVEFWAATIGYYRSTYAGKPILFLEMGTRDFDGAARADDRFWGSDGSDLLLDHQEFADQWYTYLAASCALGLDGISVWLVELNPSWVLPPRPGQWHITGTPAALVVSSFFGD